MKEDPRSAIANQKRLGSTAAGGVAAEEGGNFVAVAADGHGTPAAAAGAGIVVEEEAAGWVRTASDRRARTFDEEFSAGASNGGEEPLETTFTGHKLKGPGAVAGNEFVVTLGDAEDFVDRFDPGRWKGFLVDDGSEDGAERFAQAKNAEEDCIDGVGFGEEQGP